MSESIEALEQRLGALRVAVRKAVLSGETVRAAELRAEFEGAESAWEAALTVAAQSPGRPTTQAKEQAGSLLPLREQVYEALSLLHVPAAPKLIATVHEAFFGSTFPTARVTSLKRDEERSFRSAPFARPYYLCAALSADYLSPSRGLLAVSTWPMEMRVIGSLSPRVDFLTAAIRVAEAIERIPAPPLTARRLLQRFAASIPGAAQASAEVVKRAAEAELSMHAADDTRVRKQAAVRAGQQLAAADQFFGIKFQRMTDAHAG